MNLSVFFDGIRPLFGGKLNQKQVNGLRFIIDEWVETGFTDRRWLAYALATAFHETAHTMQPIREIGRGRGKRYGKADRITGKAYYGRGYVQLTWKTNYKKASQAMGIDFVNKPDLVMKPENAAFIMFQGMKDGWFTGKGFSDYINDNQRDYWNARRIINGTDRAELIAGYAVRFESALDAARAAADVPETVPAPDTPDNWLILLLRAIIGLFRRK